MKTMKPMVALVLVLFMVSISSHAARRIRVVASTLDMADFAKQIGGDLVEVYSITQGKTDLHFYEPRPTQVMKLHKADLLIVGGLDIDVWIQSLIDASRNPKIQFGSPGYVDPSHGVLALDVPQGRIDGSMGDVHPWGNPHFWFTPENVCIAIENIYEGLCRISPGNKETFKANKERYLAKVARTFKQLQDKMAPFRGTKVVQYHESWNYFCQTFGLEIIGTMEPKPGIPPSAGHLSGLLRRMQAEGVQLILVEPYYPERKVRAVASKTGAKVLRLPLYTGGRKGVSSYLENLRCNVEAIVAALSQ